MDNFAELVQGGDAVRALNAYYAGHGHLPDDHRLIPFYFEAMGIAELGEDVELYIKRTFRRS